MRFSNFLIGIIVISALFSCGVSKNTSTGNLIQKRKYTRGFYICSRGHNFGKTEEAHNEEAAEDIDLVPKRTTGIELKGFDNRNVLDVNVADKIVLETEKDFRQGNKKESEIHSVKLANHNWGVNENNIQPDQPNVNEEYQDKYRQVIKDNYRKSWDFTLLAIFALVGTIILADLYIGLMVLFGLITLTMYILMFVFLVRTGEGINLYLNNGGAMTDGIGTIRFFLWLHIVIGSLCALLLFFIPFFICKSKINKAVIY